MRSFPGFKILQVISAGTVLAVCLGAGPAKTKSRKNDVDQKALAAVAAEFQKLEKTLRTRRKPARQHEHASDLTATHAGRDRAHS
ncbi:hypothetical protein EBZ80_14415 [bacterium]|nr:hypothetical protein [bacterium]